MKLRPFHFSFRSFAAAGFAALLALASGIFVFVTPAGAAGVASLTGFAVSPTAIPGIGVGRTSQPGSNISFTLPNSWTSGDTIVLQLAPHGGTNCPSTTDFVSFQGTPSVTSTTHVGDTTPIFSVVPSRSVGDPLACGAGNDILTATITNSPSGTGSDTFTVTVSGFLYNVGTTADLGNIAVAISSDAAATTYFTLTTGKSSPPSNAAVTQATATANNPPVAVTSNGVTGTISNIVVNEITPGAVNGSLCITPFSSAAFPTHFAFTTAGAAAFSGGTAGVAGAAALSGSNILVPITTPSTGAGVYTISGAGVTTSTTITGPAAATVTTGGASCAADTTQIANGLVVFGVAPVVSAAIAGGDADGTAIAEMARSFPFPGSCPAGHTVVLATDNSFPDALAASYLAGFLGTGILLTPAASLSNETQTAMENEGITSVDVVGGTVAISQNTINQVNATPSYACGGPSMGSSTGTMHVTQVLAGPTQYDTAQQIAAFPGSGAVHSFNLSGAYAGQYNNTVGNESSTPVTTGALRTAIVATGASFQDAAGASVLAYANQFPIVLTDPNALSSQASTTLQALGIQQAIVLGGPVAVSPADVTSIVALNISVIRVAGTDATDTAQELATLELQSTSANAGLGWGGTWGNKILASRGDFFSDALAGAVLAHLGTTPLLLTEDPANVGGPLTGFLNQGGSAAGVDGLGPSGNIQTIQPLGGSLALFFSTLTAMAAAVAAG